MENILFECQECNVLSSQSGFCINGHTLIPVHYVKKEDHLIEVTRLKARLDTNRAQVEALIAKRDAWKRAIEGLTPGGSEFVDDPEACAKFIKERTRYPRLLIDARLEIAELKEKLGFSQEENCEFRKERGVLKGYFHRIIGNLHNSEIVLEICDKVLREVFDA